ncbi:MAG: CCA tRNA nucleotidyltransferase [Candidatus Gracilibacteria bacterium]|nr:CCA tRNA nucleotidyltransferase [Candidatus Gracilibacteria bacterium]
MKDFQKIVHHFQDLLGIKLYLVGGSVRDMIMKKPHNDLDFATPSQPEEIEAAIRKAGLKPLTMGKRFGTLAFKYHHKAPKEMNIPKEPIEITTFRTEEYNESRKPKVKFVNDITQDLSRRDFTVNAIAVGDKGKLIDPFGGYADIKQGNIRFVGEPAIRINEDPLRMLRACRLASQFSFISTRDTEDTISEHAFKILNISKERWTSEMDKILKSDHPHRGLDMLCQTQLMRFILPEIWIQYHYDQNSPYHRHSLYEHTKITVQRVEADPIIRWAALLHDVGKPFARIDKTIKKQYFTIIGWRETIKRLWKRDTQSNYPYHSEIGAEMVEKIGKYLKWSKDRTATIKDHVLNHLEEENSPIGKADSAAR